MSYPYSASRLAALMGDASPTPQQTTAIEAPVAPQLIVAGAGSGKTTTMAARVVWLIANGLVRPDQILGLTFTRKAASELARKIRQRLSRLTVHSESMVIAGEPTVSTYHSYASGIVNEHGLRAGIEAGASVLSPSRAWQLAYSTVASYDGDMTHVHVGLDEVVRQTLSLSDELAEHLVDSATLYTFTEELLADINRRVTNSTQKILELRTRLQARLQLLPLVDDYRRRKREMGAIDYADQMSMAASVALASTEVGNIERRRFKVVLLDEYQDTSHSQVTLLSSLFSEGHPVTAVGDPCQSIYAWRGASASTLSRFADQFLDDTGTPAAHAELTTSWRNRRQILTVANALSAPLRELGGVSQLRPGIEGDGAVTTGLFSTVDDEAQWLAGQIASAWTQADDTACEPRPTTAVLVRKRSQISAIAKAVEAAGLPVEVTGLGGLLDAPEVREVHAMLTVLARPTSGPALMRVLTGVRWRIGPRDIAALYSRARDLAPAKRGYEPSADGLDEVTLSEAFESPGDAEQYSPAAVERFGQLRDELLWLRSRIDQPIGDLIAEITRISGLNIEVAVHHSDSLNLETFSQEAAHYSAGAAVPSLEGFLSYLDAAQERERGLEIAGAVERKDAVQIMTMHAAKGLEWDLVAVPGVCEGVFPGKSRSTDWVTTIGKLPFPLRGDAMELPQLDLSGATTSAEVSKAHRKFGTAIAEHNRREERRLAYVAFTRSRHNLLVTGYWWDSSAAKRRGPSEFLDEVREYATIEGPWEPEPASADNPLRAAANRTQWPIAAPLGAKQDDIYEAAIAVRDSDRSFKDSPASHHWKREAELLLAERELAEDNTINVPVPSQLSVSQLVSWHGSEQQFAQRLRRPIPQPPAPHTRRGTAFHAWVEERFKSDALFGLDELPGAHDEAASPDLDLAELRDAFERSQWSSRTPFAVEVPFATVLRGVVVRGRMDAVFRNDQGKFEVVDWKTGALPEGEHARAAAVQLAAYQQAWAALRGIEVSQVSAAFYYVRQNLTVWPSDLPNIDQLSRPLSTDIFDNSQ